MRKQIGWIELILFSSIFLQPANAEVFPTQIAQLPSPETQESSTAPSGRTPISETKRSLIFQLLELTGGRQQYEQMHQIMFAQMQQQIRPMLEHTVRSREDLPPGAIEAEISKMSADINSFLTQFGESIRTQITYDAMLEQVYYPVYDRYFTEEDLHGLIAFYNTPVGEKLIAVSPQLLQDSMQLTNEVFMPQMLEIMAQLMDQQFDQVNGPTK